MPLEEFAFCGVEAELILVWELLLSPVRSLCPVAQLLGLVFPSLPVFASGGWGVNVTLLLL